MYKHNMLIVLIFMSSNVIACANHIGTTIPHIYDDESFLNAVDKQDSEVKELTMEDMLKGVAAASPEIERKNKFMAYYTKNVLHKNKS